MGFWLAECPEPQLVAGGVWACSSLGAGWLKYRGAAHWGASGRIQRGAYGNLGFAEFGVTGMGFVISLFALH